MHDERKLPVIWQQAFLCFAQRYKLDLSAQQRLQLKELTRHQQHPLMSLEIRRELNAATNPSAATTAPTVAVSPAVASSIASAALSNLPPALASLKQKQAPITFSFAPPTMEDE